MGYASVAQIAELVYVLVFVHVGKLHLCLFLFFIGFVNS
jgi:hypothetical protein